MDILCDDINIYISHFLDMKSLLLYNSIDKYTLNLIKKDFVSNLLFINYYPLYKINEKKLNNNAYKYIGKKSIYDLLLSCFYSHCKPSTCCLKEHKRPLNHLGLAWGPTCGGLWEHKIDMNSYSQDKIIMYLKKQLYWFSMTAHTYLPKKGIYNIYIRCKFDETTIYKDFNLLVELKSNNSSQQEYLELKKWKRETQELLSIYEWHNIYLDSIFILQDDTSCEIKIENTLEIAKGYACDGIYILPYGVDIK